MSCVSEWKSTTDWASMLETGAHWYGLCPVVRQCHSWLQLHKDGALHSAVLKANVCQTAVQMRGMIYTAVWGEKTNQKLLYLPTNLCTDSVFMFKSANTAAKRHKEKNVKQWPSSIVLGVVLVFFANLWTTQVTSTSGIFVLATLWLKTTTKKTRTAETKDKIKSEQNIWVSDFSRGRKCMYRPIC